MRTVRHPSWLWAIGTALCGVLLGCDPEPHFDTPEAPVPGLLLTEKSVVASPSDQEIGLLHNPGIDGYRIRASIPGGAYPAGTRVTVRLLYRLDSDLDQYIGLGALVWIPSGRLTALQILPAERDPERPLRVDLVSTGTASGSNHLLHARERDVEWSVVSRLDTSGTITSFDVTKSGLWTSTWILSDMGAGRKYRRTALMCGRLDMAHPRPVLLDLSNGVYSATTVNDQGCRITRTAPTVYRDDQICFKLATEVCLQPTTALEVMLAWKSGNSDCASTDTAREYYTTLNPGDPDPLPPEPANGCPPETGNLPEDDRE